MTKAMKNGRIELSAGEQILSEAKIPRWHLPRRLTLAIVISCSNDAPLLDTQEIHWEQQIHIISGKDKPPYVHRWYQAICKKKKKKKWTWNPDMNNKNIQPGYWNGIWHWKSAMLSMKVRKEKQLKG